MPQPIDLQTQLGQLTTAERVQQIADRLSLAAQQRTLIETQEQRLEVETQVQQTHAKTDELGEEELRRRTPYRGRRPKHDGEPEESEPTPPAPLDVDEHHIDIQI